MKALRFAGAFRKDLKRIVSRGYDRSRLDSIVDALRQGSPLPASSRAHPLKGEWKDYWALICQDFLVLPLGIEPRTSPLPRECSTTELRQRDWPRRIEYEKAPSRAILATGRPRGASWGGNAVATGLRGQRACLGFLTVPLSSWPNPAKTRNERAGMLV